MASGLLSKTEKRKEDNGANNGCPSCHLKGNNRLVAAPPQQRGDLVHPPVVCVRVRPADPGEDSRVGSVENGTVESNRHGTQEVASGKCHQAEIPIGAQGCLGCQELAELSAPFPERTKGKHTITCGNESDDGRP